jgi:hypothetical protein
MAKSKKKAQASDKDNPTGQRFSLSQLPRQLEMLDADREHWDEQDSSDHAADNNHPSTLTKKLKPGTINSICNLSLFRKQALDNPQDAESPSRQPPKAKRRRNSLSRPTSPESFPALLNHHIALSPQAAPSSTWNTATNADEMEVEHKTAFSPSRLPNDHPANSTLPDSDEYDLRTCITDLEDVLTYLKNKSMHNPIFSSPDLKSFASKIYHLTH